MDGIVLSIGNPAVYVFEAQGTQHLMFRADDQDIHELWRDATGWNAHDPTEDNGAPFAVTDPCGYMFSAQNTQCVVYSASNQGSTFPVQLYWDAQGWHHALPTDDIDVNLQETAGKVSGYMFDAQGTQHINYRGADNHIYELWWNSSGWSYSDLTEQSSGAPLAAGDPYGYVFDAQGTQHVLFLAADGHIHELWWNGAWNHHDPTGDNGAPNSVGNPTAYIFKDQGTQHVHYRGADNHIHELLWTNGNWSHNDLTVLSGAEPNAVGDPTGYVFDAQGTQHVNYRGADNHVYELWWSSVGWGHSDLMERSNATVNAAGDPAGYVFKADGTQHVIYRGLDGHMYELLWSNGAWTCADLSFETRTLPPAAPTGMMVVTPIQDRRLTVAWTDNSNNEEGFTVTYHGTGPDAGQSESDDGTISLGPNSETATLLNLYSGYHYVISVVAYNFGGNSGSSTAEATTPARVINVSRNIQGSPTGYSVSGTGFSPSSEIIINVQNGSVGQNQQFTDTTGGDGKFMTTVDYANCIKNVTVIIFTAYEEADPLHTSSQQFNITC